MLPYAALTPIHTELRHIDKSEQVHVLKHTSENDLRKKIDTGRERERELEKSVEPCPAQHSKTCFACVSVEKNQVVQVQKRR